MLQGNRNKEHQIGHEGLEGRGTKPDIKGKRTELYEDSPLPWGVMGRQEGWEVWGVKQSGYMGPRHGSAGESSWPNAPRGYFCSDSAPIFFSCFLPLSPFLKRLRL